MPADKKEIENLKAISVMKTLGNVFSDYDNNVTSNDALSRKLEEMVSKFEVAETVSSTEFFQLLNQAMERTKSDPHASNDDEDRLKDIAQMIYNVLKFKHPHPGLIRTLIKEFQEELVGAQRRHFHYRDEHWHDYVGRIFESYEVIEPTSIYPSPKQQQKEESKSESRKIKFRK